jgi:hypothetical protein
MIDGNKVTITAGGIPITLVHNGDTLEGNFMGEVVHYKKK